MRSVFFFRLLGSSSLHVNSPWVYKQVFPLIITGVFKLNKNGLYVPQLLWSLSFRLFETMVISNARNNPCPLSHNATFFFYLSIIILVYTVFLSFVLPFWLIYFETDARETNLLTLLTFLFCRSRTTTFADLNLRIFFGIRDIIISEY